MRISLEAHWSSFDETMRHRSSIILRRDLMVMLFVIRFIHRAQTRSSAKRNWKSENGFIGMVYQPRLLPNKL